MTNTKKSLIFSALSLLLCCALLIGTTFAWFTDSVTNTGNTIQAGNLAINAYAYDIGEGGESFTITGVNNSGEFTFEADAQAQDLKEENCSPIINDELWEPGKSSAKLLKVENAGTLAVKIRLKFETSGDLTDALWFDFIQVKSGEVTGSFTKRPMNTLSTFAENLELPIIAKGDKLEFILVYGMYEEAGNEYKETDFTANVSILAAQYTYEKDGFGDNEYDKDATYPVASAAEMKEALANGGIVSVNKDIKTDNIVDNVAARITISKPTTLNLDAKIISPDDMSNNVINFCALIVDADTTINAGKNGGIDTGVNGGYALNVREGANLTITGGSYYGGGTAVQVQEGTLTITGGHFAVEAFGEPYGYNFLLNCIDSAYKNGSAKIIVKGGTFVNFNPANNQAEGAGTNFVAEGYKVISEAQPDGDVWYTVVPE